MPRKKPPPPIPTLPLKILTDVEKIEHFAISALLDCGRWPHFNHPKAERVLATCITSVMRIQLAYYGHLPQAHGDWIDTLLNKTIETAVGLTGNVIESYERNSLRTAMYVAMASEKFSFPVPSPAEPSKPAASRKSLKAAYLKQFPGTKILDICWCADQHYSEWKRWLRGEKVLKDGSKPDVAFRAVLQSNKRPSEYRKTPRLSGWK